VKGTKGIVFGILLALCAFVFLFGSSLAEAAAPEVFKWRLQAVGPRGSTETDVIERFADQVKQASNGRLEIKVYGADEIVPTFETFDAVSQGLLEMHCNDPSYWVGKTNQCSGIITTPFLFKNALSQKIFLENWGGLEILRKVYAKHNIYLINQFGETPGTIWTKFPFKGLEEFKGKKIRGHGLWSEALKRVGISSVTMPGGEVYEAMERGVIDGLISANVAWCFDYGFHEVSNYVYAGDGINIANLEFAVNMDAWNKLPDDLKAIVSVCAREAEVAMLAINQDADQVKLHEAVEKWGVKTQPFDSASIGKMRAAMMGAIEEYAKADESYAELLKVLKKYLEVTGD